MSSVQSKYLKSFGGAFFAALILTLCLIPGIIRTRIGVNVFDEPYQMLTGMFPESAPYSPLSAYLTKWCGELFNWRWIYFRYLALGLNAASILIPGAYLYYKSRRYTFSLVTTCCALLLGTLIPNIFNIYGWDDWTQFGLVIIILTFFSYISRPKLWKIVVLAVLSAVLIFLRIPNLSILVLMSGLIWILFRKTPGYNRTRNILIYTSLSVIILFFGILAMYGSLENYINSFIENPIENHGFIRLTYSTVEVLFIVTAYICFYQAFYDLLNTQIINSHKWLFGLSPLAIFCFIFIFTVFTENIFFIWSLAAIIAVIIFGAVLFYIKNKQGFYSVQSLKLTSALVLGCIPFIGSNVGAVKFLIFPMVPILGLFIMPYLNRKLKILALCIFVAIYSLVAYKLSRRSFWDEGYLTTTYRMRGGKMDGLYTTPERGKHITETIDSFSKYSNESNKTLILRVNEDYLMEYLFNSRNSYLGSRFAYPAIYTSKEYVDWAEKEIENSDKPVVVLWQKFDTFELSDIPDLPMLSMLEKHLKRMEDIDGYLIYASPNAKIMSENKLHSVKNIFINK